MMFWNHWRQVYGKYFRCSKSSCHVISSLVAEPHSRSQRAVVLVQQSRNIKPYPKINRTISKHQKPNNSQTNHPHIQTTTNTDITQNCPPSPWKKTQKWKIRTALYPRRLAARTLRVVVHTGRVYRGFRTGGHARRPLRPSGGHAKMAPMRRDGRLRVTLCWTPQTQRPRAT